MTPEQLTKFDELYRFMNDLKSSSTIPLAIDQSLRERLKETYKILASGTFTTLGGDATESITVPGIKTADFSFVTLNTVGATPRTILSSICANGSITVTFSGDPSTDHIVNYLAITKQK